MKADLSASKDQMASISEVMLKLQKTIEEKATATASSTVREAEPVLQPALNPGLDRNTAVFGRRYSPQAYPYGLPPDFAPRATPEGLSQAPTFEGQLPPYEDYLGQDDGEGDTHLGPLLHLKDPSPHELPQPNIVRHTPASPTPVKESVPFAEDKGKIEALEERLRAVEGLDNYPFLDLADLSNFADLVFAGERIESGLRKGKFEYAANMAPNNKRRAPVVGARKKEGDAHAVTTAPTWMKAPQNIQSSYQPNPPNFLIRAGNSLPTQVKGPPASERASAQRTAPAAPRPVNNTTPSATYKYAQHPKDNFPPIPMAYSELWPSLLENHLVVAIPGKVLQPPYPKWYDPGAKCVYHSGVPGHNIDSSIPFKYKVQHLISAGWLSFQEEGPNIKTNPLASHGGASVNAVKEDGSPRTKKLGGVATSRRFIYQSLQAACMVSSGGGESDECLFHLGESHDMETCPAVEELLHRLMDCGQLEVSIEGGEEPQVCMQSEEKRVPLTPKALVICFTRKGTGSTPIYPRAAPKPMPFAYQSNKAVPNGFEPGMGLGKDCLGNADVVDIKGNPYKYGLGYEPGMPGRRNVLSRFRADRVWPSHISQCFTSAGMVSEEEVAAIEEEFPQDPPSFVQPCHPDSQVGNWHVISQSEEMAPRKLASKRSRKDKAAEGTSSAPEYDSHRFRSAEHQQRFEAIKGWSFLWERRVQLRDDEYTDFQEEIVRRRWASLVTPMAKFDPDIVLEFYANAWPTEEGVRDMRSWVQGDAPQAVDAPPPHQVGPVGSFYTEQYLRHLAANHRAHVQTHDCLYQISLSLQSQGFTSFPCPTLDQFRAEVAWPGDWPEARAGEAPAKAPDEADEALSMGTNQTGKRFYQVKVKGLDTTSIKELGRLMEPLQIQAFRKIYGKILELTIAEISIEAIASLTQYYDQPLRCFTFGDFQLVPTIEEFEEILGCPLGGRKPYLSSGCLPSLSRIATVVKDSARGLDRIKQTRNGIAGLPRRYLEDKARGMANQGDWVPFMDVLALLIFGVVLFPNVDGLVDLAAIDAFLAYHHSKERPVVAVLVDLFDTFNRRCEKSSAQIICCLPALCVWLVSHLFQQDTRHPCPLQSHRSWYPMRGAPMKESMSPFLVRDFGAQNFKAIQRIHKAWETPLRKDQELRGIRNGIIGGYHEWLKVHIRGLDWLAKLKVVSEESFEAPEEDEECLCETETNMLAIIAKYQEELGLATAHEHRIADEYAQVYAEKEARGRVIDSLHQEATMWMDRFALTLNGSQELPRLLAKAKAMADTYSAPEEIHGLLGYSDMSALKEQMASMMEAMLGMRQLMEKNVATAAAVSSAAEADPTLLETAHHPPSNIVGRGRDTLGHEGNPHLGYNRAAYPYGLPPNYSPPVLQDDAGHIASPVLEREPPQQPEEVHKDPQDYA
ncbi:hypothetical protein GmHk_14G041150 [Glycine max]|nr:hypothetical protein GmHk_14G041150 [Glycine max]